MTVSRVSGSNFPQYETADFNKESENDFRAYDFRKRENSSPLYVLPQNTGWTATLVCDLPPLSLASAQARQLAGRPAAHHTQDLDAHALAQAQLLEVGVVTHEQRVEADQLLGRGSGVD